MSHFFGLSPGSGVSPHPDLPQGQMDSLLSIISSQRERFRSRNQELEAVSHTLDSSRARVRVRVFLMCLFVWSCRRTAPCSRPCRPCRTSWTAWGRTTLNSTRRSNSCRATPAKCVAVWLRGAQQRSCVPCCWFFHVTVLVVIVLQAGGSDDTVMRYSSQYEERLDPFASFSRKVREN